MHTLMFFSQRRSSRRRAQVGFTLVEMLVMMVILAALVIVATQYLYSSWGVQSLAYMEAQMKTSAEKGLNTLGRHLTESTKLMGRGEGESYVNKLNMSQAPRPIPNSQLPLVRKSGSVSPEKNCEVSPSEYFLPNAVGNSLMFFENLKEHRLSASAGFTAPQNFSILQLNYVYITDNAQDSAYLERPQQPIRVGTSTLPAQHLIRWRSVPVMGYNQLRDYYQSLDAKGQGADKSKAAQSLHATGVKVAWDADAPNANDAFYDVRTNGTLSKHNGSYRLEMLAFEDTLRLGKGDGTTYSVSYNSNTDENHPGFFPVPPRIKVPYYYSPTLQPGVNCPQITPVPTATPALDFSFPRGFEVVVVGPQSGRQVLMHVSMVAKGYSQKTTAQSHSISSYARDL